MIWRKKDHDAGMSNISQEKQVARLEARRAPIRQASRRNLTLRRLACRYVLLGPI